MKKLFLAAWGVASMTACGIIPLDTGDTSVGGDTDGGGGGGGLSASDIDVLWDAGSSAGQVEISVNNTTAEGFWFGMAETNSDNGWYGEDCLNGTGQYNYCHYFYTPGGSLDFVDDPDAVVEGQTTLLDGVLAFDESANDRITYFIQLDLGDEYPCYVWGHSPGYYSSEGCTAW